MSNKSRKNKSDVRSNKRFIFNCILSFGTDSSKADIMGDNPLEEKVYTKRINIDTDYEGGLHIASVSLTSDNPNFTDASNTDISIRKVRINTKNYSGKWVNIFLNEAPTKLVNAIAEKLSMKYDED